MDWKDGIRFCDRCGFPIVKAAAESSADCNHEWLESPNHHAVCIKCNYEARGNDYRSWFRKYGKWDSRYKPKCLICREPVMKEGSICPTCNLTVPEVVL